jgi:hypothetical protein
MRAGICQYRRGARLARRGLCQHRLLHQLPRAFAGHSEIRSLSRA